ncbi:hypothetical protein [Myroides pelagicus]|uniref:Uncharacterized protein n=1 Tax=Myroides pelagicus TaxID=270914 RepID=A0A7K1GS61_9FLAO|nr:hypothetical protein [Myroides pelagicus]MEC4112686.1 hypothetical protein [Myroides pelagicus]MTH30913.1 hypothetical protein [Myroides pelagicus]
MLNKGVRSEEDRRIESIVLKLSSIGFVPEQEACLAVLDEELKKIGLSYEHLLITDGTVLAEHLYRFNFNWGYMEQFADILVKWSVSEPSFKDKAKALYAFIQNESKSFSFDIMTKISRL